MFFAFVNWIINKKKTNRIQKEDGEYKTLSSFKEKQAVSKLIECKSKMGIYFKE